MITGPCCSTVSRTVWAGRLKATDGEQLTTTWEDLAQEYLDDGARVKPKDALRAPVFCTVRDECTSETCDSCNEGESKHRHRCDRATTAVTALVFEYDGKELDWLGVVDFLSEFYHLASLAYDSPSATADAPKWRLVIPITAPWLETSKWSQAYKALQATFESLVCLQFDKTTSNPSRIFYPPTRPTAETAPRRVVWTPGKALDVAATLASLPKPGQETTAPRSEPRTPRNEPSAIRRATAYLARMEPSIDGEGGSVALIRAAQAMVRGFELSESDAMRLLEQEFNPRCEPPWSKRELEHKVESTLKGGTMPFGALLEAQNDWTAPNEGPQRDAFNVYEEPKEKEPSALATRWKPLGVALEGKLHERPVPHTWLLKDGSDGVFPLGKCGVIASPGGLGKTTVLAQLAVAVAVGSDWLGFQVASPGKVVLCLGEEDMPEIHRRIHRIVNHLKAETYSNIDWNVVGQNIIAIPLAGEEVSFVQKSMATQEIKESTFHQEFQARLTNEPDVKLIILDPLSRFAGAETEIDNAAATKFVQAIEKLANTVGCSVLVAHHSAKAKDGEPSNIRGASAISDGFRWAATMTKEECGFVRLDQFKTNYSKSFRTRYLEWVEVTTEHCTSPGGDDYKVETNLGAVLVKANTDKALGAIDEAKKAKKKEKARNGSAKPNGNGKGQNAGQDEDGPQEGSII